MSVTILPRRHRQHPTMQPIAMGRRRAGRVVNVRVPSTSVAIAEYRDSAQLLRDLGSDLSAAILDATADALQSQESDPEDTIVTDVKDLHR